MKISLEDSDDDEIEVVLKGKLNSLKVQEILNKLSEIQLSSIISYRIGEKTFFEDIQVVEYFTCEDTKIFAIIKKEKHKINFNLSQLENLENFIRISKNTIVNKKYVKYIEVEFNGNYYLYMKNNIKFILTRKYVKKFKESMR